MASLQTVLHAGDTASRLSRPAQMQQNYSVAQIRPSNLNLPPVVNLTNRAGASGEVQASLSSY